MKKHNSLLLLVVSICRFVLAFTFLFSGMVKLIDPRGTEYKITDYGVAFGLQEYLPLYVPLALAVLLAVVEFCLGIYIFFGIRWRMSTRFTLLFMLIMTPLTLYLAIDNPVSDCGCFGDALVLSNWQTFSKNIALLFLAIVVTIVPRKRIFRLISERNQWMISLYSLVFALTMALYCIYRLPVMDFRPYHIGVNLPEAMMAEMDEPTESPKYSDFCILSDEEGDITFEWLTQPGYNFLLVAPHLELADDGAMDRINGIYDYTIEHDYGFLCLTSSTQDGINHWCDMTGAEYPFAFTDAVTLKTVVRSNPGLLLLHDGVIINKWSANNLPKLDEMSKRLEDSEIGTLQQNSTWRKLSDIMLWYLIPLLFVTLADRIWQGSKMYKKYKRSKTINQLKNNRTMRKKIVAGNWKMNLNLQEGVALATELKNALAAEKPNCDVIICTPFIHLATVAGITEGTVIGLGAENCADKEKGAYTGEVSAAQVKSTGAQYVILGHSERRAYYGETAEILKEKTNLALANGLKVIFCIGEVLEEREANKQNEVVGAQIADSLFDLTEEQLANVILAYEPVWAIGTGKTATAEQAQDMHAFIRGCIAGRFGEKAAEEISILYGGSCKPSNAKEIFSKPDVDGGLIGGAALKCEDFKGIIDAWN